MSQSDVMMLSQQGGMSQELRSSTVIMISK